MSPPAISYRRPALLLLTGLALVAIVLPGALEARPKKASSPDQEAPPAPPKGALFLHGGASGSLEIRKKILDYLETRDRTSAKVRVLVIPLGYENARLQKRVAGEAKQLWQTAGVEATNVQDTWSLQTPEKAVAFAKRADVIWAMGGDQWDLMDGIARVRGLRSAIRQRYRSGAVFGGTGAGAVVAAEKIVDARQSSRNPLRNLKAPRAGLGLLLHTYVDTHIIEREGRTCRVLAGVINFKDDMAIGIGENTSVQVIGGTLEVFGDGSVIIVDGKKARIRNQAQSEILAAANLHLHVLRPGMQFDLQNRRVLVGGNRLSPPPRGALFLHGGGGGCMEVRKQIMKCSKIPRRSEQVRVLVVPLGFDSPRQQREDANEAKDWWREVGVKNLDVLDARALKSPAKALALVKRADVIWVMGGDQWKHMKALRRVRGLPEAIRKRYRAGSVYGGTSAGAVVAAGDIVDARENLLNLKAGLTNQMDGLGLFPYAIIDTHLLERGRASRLIASVLDYNTHLGIGIDRSTFIKVEDGTLEVFGKGTVMILDGSQAAVQNPNRGRTLAGAELGVHVLRKGMHFDLTKRKVVQ